MSLKPQELGPIPEETARVAHAAYPKGNVFMQMRDVLGTISQDEAFTHLFSHTGQPAGVAIKARLPDGSFGQDLRATVSSLAAPTARRECCSFPSPALAVDHLGLPCDYGGQDFLLFALQHVEVVLGAQ
jgi:hypothetical protein